jgi:hypothetical protein
MGQKKRTKDSGKAERMVREEDCRWEKKGRGHRVKPTGREKRRWWIG